jgi:hypothetical protein
MLALLLVSLICCSAVAALDAVLVVVAALDRDSDLAIVSLPNLAAMTLAIVTLSLVLTR